MEAVSSSPFSLRQAGAALLIGSVALLVLGVQPILLGELVARHVITMEGVGIVAMGEIITLGLGVVLGELLLPLSRYRQIALLAACATAALDVATSQASGDGQLSALRAAAGLAEGVLVWVTTSVIVRSQRPARLAAIFVIVQTVCQAAMAALLAAAIVPMGGWQGGFMALGLMSVLAGSLSFLLPAPLAPLASASAPKFAWSVPAALALGAAFMQMAALVALWAYLEPLGLNKGFDGHGVQTIAWAVLFMQVLGGIAALNCVRRLSAFGVLGAGALLTAALVGGLYLLPHGALAGFALICAVFGFVWLFLLPFHVALAFQVDPSGRLASLVPAAQLLGSAFGPLTASFIVVGEDAAPVPLLSAGLAVAAVVLVLSAKPRRSPVLGL